MSSFTVLLKLVHLIGLATGIFYVIVVLWLMR